MVDLLNSSVQELEEVLLDELLMDNSELVVYNDDHNTFDWVIESFMDICGHTYIQSEQLSLIVHFKGKAVIKTGFMEELKPMKAALIERGLSAVIESIQNK